MGPFFFYLRGKKINLPRAPLHRHPLPDFFSHLNALDTITAGPATAAVALPPPYSEQYPDANFVFACQPIYCPAATGAPRVEWQSSQASSRTPRPRSSQAVSEVSALLPRAATLCVLWFSFLCASFLFGGDAIVSRALCLGVWPVPGWDSPREPTHLAPAKGACGRALTPPSRVARPCQMGVGRLDREAARDEVVYTPPRKKHNGEGWREGWAALAAKGRHGRPTDASRAEQAPAGHTAPPILTCVLEHTSRLVRAVNSQPAHE